MFADDANLFYSNSHINEFFENVNIELLNVTDCYFAKNMSINTSKKKCIFFHKQTDRNNVP